MKEKIKINLHDYNHKCADGCCTNYGLITTVNGVNMQANNTDVGTVLRQVLEHLGYEVEIEETYDYD